jgi:hypothetical protein
MSNINQFLKGLTTGDSIKDYAHASKLFVGDNYRLSPKYGFLFHVAIDINPEIGHVPRDQLLELGMIVKAASLPKFTVDTKTLNAYNRVNIVQNKIKYDPVTITFHDDSADVVRNFWYDYYSYYYRDSDYQNSVYTSAHKYSSRQSQEWGYSPRNYPNSNPGTQQFIRAIRIYSLHQKRFSEYTLINPTITNFRHGEHANGENNLMTHEMTVAYETVKYAHGYASKNTINGFADLHYDHTPSPLTPAGGGTASILGPGGLLSTIDDVTTDLASGNILGAALKTARGAKNFRGSNLKAIAGAELTSIGMDILRGNNPLSKVNVPSISNISNKVSSGLASIGVGGRAIYSNKESVNAQASSNISTQANGITGINDDGFNFNDD